MNLVKKYFVATLMIPLLFATTSFAQTEQKFISLKDGSVLKGEIVQFLNGIYTIRTEQLGEIDIPDSNVLSISTAGALLNNFQNENSTGIAGDQAEIMGQVQQLQGDILSNPQMMQDISTLLQDQEVIKILSDENFIKDIMSYDPNRLEGNPKTEQLMQNPSIQSLMNKIEKK